MLANIKTKALSAEELPAGIEDIISKFYPGICAAGDYLYFCGDEGIMRCSRDGENPQLFSDVKGFVFTDGEKLYCGNSSRIFGLSPEGEAEILVKTRPLVNEGYFMMMNCMSAFTAEKERIYYVLTLYENHTLRCVNTDGSGDCELGDICCVLNPIKEITFSYEPFRVHVSFEGEKGIEEKIFTPET